MKIENPRVSYDSQAHILSVRLQPQKSVDSEVKGNVVLDYDEEGNLVNVDIMNASLLEFARTSEVQELLQTPQIA